MKRSMPSFLTEKEAPTHTRCIHCHEDLTEFPELDGVCDECQDNLSAIARGEFHDPDILSRDREERAFHSH